MREPITSSSHMYSRLPLACATTASEFRPQARTSSSTIMEVSRAQHTPRHIPTSRSVYARSSKGTARPEKGRSAEERCARRARLLARIVPQRGSTARYESSDSAPDETLPLSAPEVLECSRYEARPIVASLISLQRFNYEHCRASPAVGLFLRRIVTGRLAIGKR